MFGKTNTERDETIRKIAKLCNEYLTGNAAGGIILCDIYDILEKIKIEGFIDPFKKEESKCFGKEKQYWNCKKI